MRFIILIILLTGLLTELNAQAPAKFSIVQLPAAIAAERPWVKAALNGVIGQAKNKEQVFRIINDSLRYFKNLPVKIREQVDASSFRYYTYLITAPAETGLAIIDIKASRGPLQEPIRTLDALKQFFRDTTLIIDTLVIPLSLQSLGYSNSDYYLQIGGQAAKEYPLPMVDSMHAIINAQLFAGRSQPWLQARLYNRHDATAPLAYFVLRFLNADEKKELLAVATELQPTGRRLLLDHLLAYAQASWGSVQPANLNHWLQNEFPQ